MLHCCFDKKKTKKNLAVYEEDKIFRLLRNVTAHLYKSFIFPQLVHLCFLDCGPCFSNTAFLAIAQDKSCFLRPLS